MSLLRVEDVCKAVVGGLWCAGELSKPSFTLGVWHFVRQRLVG